MAHHHSMEILLPSTAEPMGIGVAREAAWKCTVPCSCSPCHLRALSRCSRAERPPIGEQLSFPGGPQCNTIVVVHFLHRFFWRIPRGHLNSGTSFRCTTNHTSSYGKVGCHLSRYDVADPSDPRFLFASQRNVEPREDPNLWKRAVKLHMTALRISSKLRKTRCKVANRSSLNCESTMASVDFRNWRRFRGNAHK